MWGLLEPVAPFTGAWIEMKCVPRKALDQYPSHPSRVRGLKYLRKVYVSAQRLVAPFTGAWIEMPRREPLQEPLRRRTLHGCVD